VTAKTVPSFARSAIGCERRFAIAEFRPALQPSAAFPCAWKARSAFRVRSLPSQVRFSVKGHLFSEDCSARSGRKKKSACVKTQSLTPGFAFNFNAPCAGRYATTHIAWDLVLLCHKRWL
jgi:hypothetical protein